LGYGVSEVDHRRDIRVSYTGGFTSVPWDIQESAVRLMRLDKSRRDGAAGLQSIGREGMSSGFQTMDLPSEIMDVWRPYRIF
jgi:hypothetical protein